MYRKYLMKVRAKKPLIHNITNYVAANDVANILLACGASPIMADDPLEAAEITSLCDGLSLNLGTLSPRRAESMMLAGKKSNILKHPVTLDPVGIGSSSFRRATALELLHEIRFSAIRGNLSEILAVAKLMNINTPDPVGIPLPASRGVDAAENLSSDGQTTEDFIPSLQALSRRTESLIIVTGAADLIVSASSCRILRCGRPEMSRITGTGCQLSALLTAFLAASPDDPEGAAAAAAEAMGTAGEQAFSALLPGEGNASYRNRIIDAIYSMTFNHGSHTVIETPEEK